jgi:hypothetical protein
MNNMNKLLYNNSYAFFQQKKLIVHKAKLYKYYKFIFWLLFSIFSKAICANFYHFIYVSISYEHLQALSEKVLSITSLTLLLLHNRVVIILKFIKQFIEFELLGPHSSLLS